MSIVTYLFHIMTSILLFCMLAPLPAQIYEPNAENFYEDITAISLLPRSTLASGIRSSLSALSPRLGIEITASIAVTPQALTKQGQITIYNILRSISRMKGIEYYSASRGEMRILYIESYALSERNKRTKIDDPLLSQIPKYDSIYSFQKDGSFGKNIYRIEYTYDNDSILLSMHNETTMVYKKVLPLIAAENMQTYVLIIPDKNTQTLQFYGNIGVFIPAAFGFQDRAHRSFYNRITALQNWFIHELLTHNLINE